MVRLLTVVFDSGVRATYSNVLHVVLNSEIANIPVMIRGDRQIVVSVPVS